MTLIRVPAAAYAALRCHAALFSTPGARHRDGSYTLAAAPELLEHLGSLALGNETLGATIVRVIQSSQAGPASEFSSIPGAGFQFGRTSN
jgi:hypothetical protein